MRVTFPRLADHEVAYAVVERDDGVVYRLQGGRAGTALPHDIRHLIVERELGVTDGIWGGIAAGVVHRGRVLHAELLADLVESIAALDAPTPAEIRRLTGVKLSALSGAAPSPEALATAARALQVEAARWARLRPGQELQYEWPSRRIPRQRATGSDPSGPAGGRAVTYALMSEDARPDRKLMALALGQARISLESGGVPVGAVLASGGEVIAAGHNERVQRGDPVAHGEISCLRNAGRRSSYADTTLYTTLSPCPMCTGAILLFQIPRVVVGEARTFAGDIGFLRGAGVEILLLDDPACVAVMEEFQARYPEVWSEDIGGR